MGPPTLLHVHMKDVSTTLSTVYIFVLSPSPSNVSKSSPLSCAYKQQQ
jgi:hypothetical protein